MLGWQQAPSCLPVVNELPDSSFLVKGRDQRASPTPCQLRQSGTACNIVNLSENLGTVNHSLVFSRSIPLFIHFLKIPSSALGPFLGGGGGGVGWSRRSTPVCLCEEGEGQCTKFPPGPAARPQSCTQDLPEPLRPESLVVL